MKTSEPVILASSSPRRRVLFRYVGVPFEVKFDSVDETILPGETPESCVVRIACLKAGGIHDTIPKRVVISADTIVELDGNILGKPCSTLEAMDMLTFLGGRTHRVLTGVCVFGKDSTEPATGLEISTVTFRRLDEHLIREYIDSGEPIGKAGAYAIQGRGFSLIETWQGSYSNIVGLPLRLTQNLLIAVGCNPVSSAGFPYP